MKTKETNTWNANKYTKHADFVSVLGLPVVELLNPKAEEHILDLGCGDGTLAVEIEKYGSKVIAVDLSIDMVEKAKEKGLDAYVMNVTDLPYVGVFDAVFSNAVLHWVKERELAVKNIHQVLKPNGRFVAEFGGYGNIEHIVQAMNIVFGRHLEYGKLDNPWHFPTVEEYTALLEVQGFEIRYIERTNRPTSIDDIANWLSVFTNGATEHLTLEQKEQFRHEVREILKEKIYSEEEGWVADYVRLRVEAVKL